MPPSIKALSPGADDLFFDLGQGQELAMDVDVVDSQPRVGNDFLQLFGVESKFQAQRLVAEYGFADVAADALGFGLPLIITDGLQSRISNSIESMSDV